MIWPFNFRRSKRVDDIMAGLREPLWSYPVVKRPTERTAKPRCYRDRKAHDKLIATTNAIRVKYGMEPL